MLDTVAHPRTIIRGLASSLAFALLVTGCSGSGSSPQTTTLAGNTTTTATSVVPTTTTTPAAGEITVADVAASVETQFQDEWDYYLGGPDMPRGVVGPVDISCDLQGEVGFGDVLECEAAPVEERENYPDPVSMVILVTGDDGSTANTWSSSASLDYRAAYQSAGGGLFCRDLVDRESFYSEYFSAVAYWFLDSQPDRMDADKDGIPCETVFPLASIADFWAGTPREETAAIHFGFVTDVSATVLPYDMNIDYATMLGGMEANRAAEAAGEIQPGEGAPNDFFISNENPRLRTFELAADVDMTLMAHIDGGIASIPVDPNLWVVLFEAAERCAAVDWLPSECADFGGEDWTWYGRATLPYWIQLEGDTIIRIEEQYLR